MEAKDWIPLTAAIIAGLGLLFTIVRWISETHARKLADKRADRAEERAQQAEERAESMAQALLKPRFRMRSGRWRGNVCLVLSVDGERAVHSFSYDEILARDREKVVEEYDLKYLTDLKSKLRQNATERPVIARDDDAWIEYIPASEFDRMPYGLKALWIKYVIQDEESNLYAGQEYIDFDRGETETRRPLPTALISPPESS